MSLGHRKLARWYGQLAQQLDAGLPFAAALRSSSGGGVPVAELEAMVDSRLLPAFGYTAAEGRGVG